MKRILCYLLVATILAATLGGCSAVSEESAPVPDGAAEAPAGESTPESDWESIFTSDDEIHTYRRIDPAKTQILVSRTGNINVEGLCHEFEKLNPDVQVIYLDITGGNSGYTPLKDWIMGGYAPDIVISAAGFFDDELTKQYFENLSGEPIIQSYEAAALQRTATENNVYWLPGPSDITAMMYNKTLFEQYGWQVPATFDEFVALCDRITADTNGEVEPWNPNAKYSDELTMSLQCFTYNEVFAGVDNYTWYNGLFTGESTLTGHLEPYTDVLQTLIDHEILREEHFSYSATTRGKEFAAGKIAMINMNIYNADNEEFDFGYMPFPTTQGELGYLCSKYSCFVGVPIRERSDAQAEAVRRFLEYFSSAEGQATYIGNSIKVSNVKGIALSGEDDLAALQPAIDAGHVFTLLNFADPVSGQGRVYLHNVAIDMAIEGRTGAECLAELDAGLAAPVEQAQPVEVEAIATVASDMNMLDTSFYIADAYRNTMGADIGLITHNEVFRGNVMRMFTGDVTADVVTVLKPRSFANESTLIKVSMTGQQLMDALNNPVGNDAIADCIYAFSGLACEVAPWNALGSKYLSVRLADGSELAADKLYTVAVWAGTVADEYITETLESYEGSWNDMLTAQLTSDGTVAPARDGRIKLVWD